MKHIWNFVKPSKFIVMLFIKKATLVLTLFLFISCSSSDYNFNPEIVTDFGTPAELQGEQLFDDVMGIASFTLLDSLILFSTMDEDMFQVYDLQGNQIASFGRQGNGPGEYIQPPFFRDTYFTQNSLDYLLFYDFSNNMTGVYLDIKASIEENEVVIEQEVPLPRVFSQPFARLYHIDEETILGVSDDRFFQELDGLEGGWYYSPADTIITTFPMYNLYMNPFDAEPESNLNNRSISVSPDRQKFATAFFHAPIIEIFDMYSTDVRLQIQVTNETFPPDDPFTPEDYYENTLTQYFRDIFTTNDHIYLLYTGQEMSDPEKQQFVKIIDWQGQPAQQFSIPPGYEIDVIQVDESNNHLYGMSWSNDAIYRFAL